MINDSLDMLYTQVLPLDSPNIEIFGDGGDESMSTTHIPAPNLTERFIDNLFKISRHLCK
jgi:hypothetical protein